MIRIPKCNFQLHKLSISVEQSKYPRPLVHSETGIPDVHISETALVFYENLIELLINSNPSASNICWSFTVNANCKCLLAVLALSIPAFKSHIIFKGSMDMNKSVAESIYHNNWLIRNSYYITRFDGMWPKSVSCLECIWNCQISIGKFLLKTIWKSRFELANNKYNRFYLLNFNSTKL